MNPAVKSMDPPRKAGGGDAVSCEVQLIGIRDRGRDVLVPSTTIDGKIVVSTGKLIKIATVRDEDVIEGKVVRDPGYFVNELRKSSLKVDIFTFGHKLTDSYQTGNYRTEWESLAVIPITTYQEWWDSRATKDVRVAVKKAARLGVSVCQVPLDDRLIEGIVRIYNESKYRQGKQFWHYGKDFDTIKRISSTYPEISIFIGAYHNGELIGFIKMVEVGRVAMTFHVISMRKHSNKKPTNALIAKAVEICALRGSSHLVYGNYTYKDPGSLLTEFKRRNGFQEVLVPRCYVPLTLKGRLALLLGLHRGITNAIPLSIWRTAVYLRALVTRFREDII